MAEKPRQTGDETTGSDGTSIDLRVPEQAAGERLDSVLASLLPDHSRSRLQTWIRAGRVAVDGVVRRPRDRLAGGERLVVQLAAAAGVGAGASSGGDTDWQSGWSDGPVSLPAEPVPLTVVLEDPAFFVLDKQVGQVMHPAPGHAHGTVLHGLLHLDPALRQLPRAGIVHRLDRDTSGLCVVARTETAHTALVRSMQARHIRREYLALVYGQPEDSGCIEAPIARHPRDRQRMAVVAGGRAARSHYRVLARYTGASLVAVRLDTGRTHQIRVHMTHIGHPLIGDPVYRFRRPPGGLAAEVVDGLERQALHAYRLAFPHPARAGEDSRVEVEIPLPADLAALQNRLKAHST